MPTISPRNGTEFEIGLEDLALLPASPRAASRSAPGRASAPTLRPPRRPRQAVVDQAGELHRQRRRAARPRVPQVAPGARAAAPQSTPPCSQKRRSSLSTIAVQQRRRHLGERHPGEPAHRPCRRARVWTGAPWRSSSVTSDGRCAAFTSANVGSGAGAGRARRARPSSATHAAQRARDRFTARPRSRAFGASPKLSGAYIASTRVGGSANRPGLLRRTRVLDDVLAARQVLVVAAEGLEAALLERRPGACRCASRSRVAIARVAAEAASRGSSRRPAPGR